MRFGHLFHLILHACPVSSILIHWKQITKDEVFRLERCDAVYAVLFNVVSNVGIQYWQHSIWPVCGAGIVILPLKCGVDGLTDF